MRIIYTGLVLIQAAFCFCADAGMNAPAYPPKRWRLWVNVNFSRDVLVRFLDKKPDKSEFLGPDTLSLWFTGDGSITGSTTHPVLTHKLPSDGLGGLGSEVIGYVSQADQTAIYSNACAVLQGFHFVNSFTHTNFEDSGIDISVDVEINGRSASVRYNKVQANDGLPPDVCALFALIRRSLPSSYSSLCDYLHVPRLPALSAEQATRYRQCQLHHDWMRIDDVPIAYGLPSCQKAYSAAQKKTFPNANLYAAGGCVVSPDSPKTEKVLYCPTCRKTEAEWQERHDKKTKQIKR